MREKRGVTALMNFRTVKNGYTAHGINEEKIYLDEKSRKRFKHKPYSCDFVKEKKDEWRFGY